MEDFTLDIIVGTEGNSRNIKIDLPPFTLDDFVVDVLANSGIELTKATALAHLVEEGYLARRNYSGIEHLLIQANAQRNIKGKK